MTAYRDRLIAGEHDAPKQPATPKKTTPKTTTAKTPKTSKTA